MIGRESAIAPDGKRFALSQLRDDKAKKGDAVLIGDAKTGKVLSFETPTSMWALAFAKNGTLVMAGYLKPVDPLPKDPHLLSWGHLMPPLGRDGTKP